MKPSGQRVVPVNVRPFYSFLRVRTLACLLSCVLVSLPGVARAQDGGVPDAPLAVRTDTGLLLNPAAEKALDDELKRLQGVERQHKNESWFKVVAVSAGVGLILGVAGGIALGFALKK